MTTWIVISIASLILALVGLAVVALQYRRGQIGLAELLVSAGGFIVFVGAIVVGEIVADGPPAWLLTILLPLWFLAMYWTRRRAHPQ